MKLEDWERGRGRGNSSEGLPSATIYLCNDDFLPDGYNVMMKYLYSGKDFNTALKIHLMTLWNWV